MNVLTILLYKSQWCIRYILFKNYGKIIYLTDIMNFKKMSKILDQLCFLIFKLCVCTIPTEFSKA